jgi:hypothetical protein
LASSISNTARLDTATTSFFSIGYAMLDGNSTVGRGVAVVDPKRRWA